MSDDSIGQAAQDTIDDMKSEIESLRAALETAESKYEELLRASDKAYSILRQVL